MTSGSPTRRLLAVLLVALGCAAGGCDDVESPTSPGTNPHILGVAPQAPQPSSTPQILTITGERFITGLTLTVQSPGGASSTISGSAIQLAHSSSFTANVLLDTPGTYTLTVRNANGDASTSFLLVVRTLTGTTPTITAISPSGVPRSNQSVLLTFTGTQFAPNMVVTVVDPLGGIANVSPGAVQFFSPTSLSVQVVLSVVGYYAFAVSNGVGEVSNYTYVSVN